MLYIVLVIIVASASAFIIFLITRSPSNDRNWSKDQKVLPSVSTYGDTITVHNVRRARYRSIDDYGITYSNVTFAIQDIKKAWIIIESFGNWSLFGLSKAHVLISFQFGDGTYLSISPEVRKKKNENFSPLKGLFRSYELMYVVADEKDTLSLRTNYRKDPTRLYPLTLKESDVQKLFIDISKEINLLYSKASFYNTATNSCTTIISGHLRAIGIKMPKYHMLYLLAGTIDSLFNKYNLIDTKLTAVEARKHFYITTIAQQCEHSEDFSKCIRKDL